MGSLYGLRVLVFSWRLKDTDGCDGWASNALPEIQSLGSKLAAVANSLLISEFSTYDLPHLLRYNDLCAAPLYSLRSSYFTSSRSYTKLNATTSMPST